MSNQFANGMEKVERNEVVKWGVHCVCKVFFVPRHWAGKEDTSKSKPIEMRRHSWFLGTQMGWEN